MFACLLSSPCACLTHMDCCVGLLICLIHAFSQSVLGVMYLPIPFLFVPCTGIFLSIYYTYSIRTIDHAQSQQLMLYFMVQQFYNVYFLVSRDVPLKDALVIALDVYFLVTASCGVCLAYHMSQLVKLRPSFSALAIVPSSPAPMSISVPASVSSYDQRV